ncbi:cytochrome b5 domain-containing protein 1-like [Macrosteles quadrilineatus]|uniref:cytochrome b5 domain-containing protein 1-like n=1 Tax=Macrosteles quadrilineatus TaxID=74068 RepID=UPI0023E0CCDC|nr:cytochrome b5 domain-containing protein 1-like [Macrosteles quadrilineatus]
MCENDCLTFKLTCNQRKPTSRFDELKSKLKRKTLPFFTPKEVVVHNSENDCWVSFLGIVRDLTPLVREYQGTREVMPVLAFAGKDISHWFDPRTGEIKHHIHPVTGVRVPYTPHGPVPHVLPQVPSSEWRPLDTLPWWFDVDLVVGYVTRAARPIRINNKLTGEEVTLEVCSEDTLDRILQRYSMFNSSATGYTWKYETRTLNSTWTLDENGIPDMRLKLRQLRLPEDLYVPCLMLYFNDDHRD